LRAIVVGGGTSREGETGGGDRLVRDGLLHLDALSTLQLFHSGLLFLECGALTGRRLDTRR